MSEHVLDAVRDLIPDLRERAEHAEKDLAVSGVTVKELSQTGLLALLRPHEFGGTEGELVTFCTAIKEVARACGSTGLITAALAVTPWRVAIFPHKAQTEVWGEAFDTTMSSSVSPSGAITASSGKYTVNGRWKRVPGCEHANWLVVRGTLASGEDADVLIAAGEYTVETAEPLLGLRGAMTRDVVAHEVAVAAHRVRPLGTAPDSEPDTFPPSPVALYRLPADAVIEAAFTAAVIGMAEGALAEYINLTTTAPGAYQLARVAAAASDVDAAWLLLTRNICDMVAHTIAREEIPAELLLRTHRDHHLAVERAAAATSALVESAGAAATDPPDTTGPLARQWRDVQAARALFPAGGTETLARYARAVLSNGGLSFDNHTTEHLEEE
ncbi:acyl-CoA dehydrogenase family protein [Hoyosella altamirensis]|uniref:3-hydroxy-9,10-secoandrosta-1,3,5(10)-triene-9, 17-dione monooxygenase n=1 Tax=Hoyosella altamirensis TaxID=616997 RepID=A0A839RRR4_9ACTN|nr:acyl-CoA dehydrogenase family protein [Hoyosella altamirensis]MBB3039230.1 3-hydroxy-9,10-secoandrosta-1,3,5(10)-triene-9,17-dione monooxygenase [Hoyosella altamirensis]